MGVRLPPHSHCRICEAIVSEGEESCSTICESHIRDEQYAERQRSLTLFVVVILALTGVFALSFFL